ncbi:hypothetical protein Tco_0823296 [Tanacetum coccineum]|uniref:Uncharacterized protein n=1 Tax=Tanacetum coccineum TaxID=301880 RepID=A0ABQ5AKT6_9ASTR
MEDDTTHGGFHEESPVRPDDAPTPTADAAGRAEDPALLTSLSAKLDRCMGRIDSLETELGKSKKIMGGAILTLVSRVKEVEKTVKQLRDTRLVVDASAHVEERKRRRFPSRCKRPLLNRRARTEFSTPAFEQFQANLSAGVLPHTQSLNLLVPIEDLQNVSEERTKELDDLMMRMTETDWLNLMMQVGSNPALAKELLGAECLKRGELYERNGLLVERVSSQPASVPAATPHTADDPDSAGGGSSNPAGSATPMAGFAASNTAGGTLDATMY